MTARQRRLLWRIIVSAVLLAAAVIANLILRDSIPLWGTLLLYLPAYLLVGIDVLWRAVRNIARGDWLDECFLMSIATLGALGVGFLPSGKPEFAEAVFVMLFYQGGELAQSIAVGKSRRSIAALMDIRPDTARALREGKEVICSPEEVAVGETVLIYAGERIPLDGIILEGATDLDTAALTGESAPLSRTRGDAVFSGATNLSGTVSVRVEKSADASTAARILSLVEEASEKKSKSEQFITRFARIYTPAVVACALFLALLPPLFSGQFLTQFPLWLTRALSFLVISCPCALVISVPLAFFGGIGAAAKAGILVKGSLHMEGLSRARVVAFDKTGTLTKGQFSVSLVHPVHVTASHLLTLAAAAEQHSSHPLAKALRRAVPVDLPPVTKEKEMAGRGIIATVAGKQIAVGNLSLMDEVGAVLAIAPKEKTTLYVAENGRFIGYILLEDTVKETAGAALCALAEVGVSRTVMLTGDREGTAREVAERLGLAEWHAELLPADKMRELEILLAAPHRGTVLFVGDGINDAPVLARADVGIAMGVLGTDAAIEAADVVLMDDDPTKLATAIRLAKKTVAIAGQNIAITLIIKALALLLGALGVFGAWQMPIAVFADVGVCLLATLNAMRALNKQ